MRTLKKLFYTVILLGLWVPAQAQTAFKDSMVNKEIALQLSSRQTETALYYPNSVKRFYVERQYDAAWIKPQNGTGQAWQAMLMIDCVLQFGLSHSDYHPKVLLYNTLHDLIDQYDSGNAKRMARFDILLTDAIIALMNHLHYGKLNPNYTAGQINMGMLNKFQADLYLKFIVDKKGLIENIANVQPQCKKYTDMQVQMHVLKGLYLDDCYEVPEADVRKIAINMERLRWAEIDEPGYLLINIPSYCLDYYLPDTIYQFKIVVGKPGTPTPTLQSAIRYFTTAPEWRVPAKIFNKEILPKALADTPYLQNNHYALYDNSGHYVEASTENIATIKKYPSKYRITQSAGCENALGLVVFRFDNIYDIYLHDTPEQKLFQKEKRAFSHGCIRVEDAQKLAVLLLQHDNSNNRVPAFKRAISNLKTVSFTLKAPVPVKVTYLTCEMKDGLLVEFDDIYGLDHRLEMELYGVKDDLSFKRN